MTDLLASLVDRTLLSVPVLQRRQPTLFEPVAEAAFGARSQLASSTSIQEENDFVDVQPATVSRASGFEPRNHSKRTSFAPKETIAGEVEAQHIQSQHQRQALPPLDQAKSENTPVASSRNIETIIEKRVERERVSEPAPEIQTKKEAANPDSPAVELRKPSREAVAEAKEPLTIKTKLLSSKSAEPPIKPRAQKPLPSREVSPRVRGTSRSESVRAVKQPAPPAIHVTIGRVEVRATTQAPSQTRAAPTRGPRVSLEDYLRSRSEGTRNK